MRYHLGHVVLDLPLVLLDETQYVFANKEEGLSLFISFEPPAPAGITPDGVLDELSGTLLKGYQGMCIQHFRKPLTFLGDPAAQAFLQLGLALGGGEIHLLAASGARQVTLIKLITGLETNNREGLAMFEHMLRSAASAQATWSPKAERAGYVRRQAGLITLEMPEVLGLPRGFSFSSQDRAARLTLQFEEGPPSAGAPIFEDLLPPQDPDTSLELMGEEEKPFSAGSLRGDTGRWEVRSLRGQQELDRYVVHRLSIPLAGGRTFQALGLARRSGAATLESAWTQLTTTLRPGG
jgi:hypothetical protein